MQKPLMRFICPDESDSVDAARPPGSVLSQSAGHCEEELTVQER